MRNLKHTPGPWKVINRHNTFLKTIIALDGNGEFAASIGDVSDDANAALISAAPNMFKDLQEIISCWEFNKGSLELDQIAIDHIKATLRKARGE
jgi:hypothetical protein